MCVGARARLRTDGPMSRVELQDHNGEGLQQSRTPVEQRMENTAVRTVDAVLGDIDDLLAEFQGEDG